MVESLRSGRNKANNRYLKAKTFGPVENARKEAAYRAESGSFFNQGGNVHLFSVRLRRKFARTAPSNLILRDIS